MTDPQTFPSFTSPRGHTIQFRTVTADDLDDMLGYINALIAEDTYIGLFGQPMTREEEESALAGILEASKKGDKLYIAAYAGKQYIGSGEIRRNHLRRKRQVGEIGISLLDGYRSEGIGTYLMNLLIAEAKKSDYRILTLTCFANNPRALHVYEKLGFRRVGSVPGAIVWKDGYIDEVVMYLPLAR